MAASRAPPTQTASGGLHELLRQVAKDTPRFLFRRWTSKSGGDSRLNTVNRITPHAFMSMSTTTRTIEDVPEGELIGLWNGHYIGESVVSPFSSWSASQKLVLHMASDRTGFASVWDHASEPADDAFISVVDTTKLGVNNVVLWTAHPLLKTRGDLYGRVNEFLIFGVVEGAAHNAVQAKKIWEQGLPRLFPKIELRPSVHEQMAVATSIASLFRADFALPLICYLLSRRPYAVTPLTTSCPTMQDLHPKLVPLLIKQFGIRDDQVYDVGTHFTSLMVQSPDVAEALALLRKVTSDGKETNVQD